MASFYLTSRLRQIKRRRFSFFRLNTQRKNKHSQSDGINKRSHCCCCCCCVSHIFHFYFCNTFIFAYCIVWWFMAFSFCWHFFYWKKRDKIYSTSFKTFSGKKISAKSDENNCGWRKFVYNFRVTISRITYPSENVYSFNV